VADIPLPFVVGLTGGIGSGKSSAADHFGRLGAYVIDADALSHRLTAPGGAAISAIGDAFPGVVADGVLDRASLRDRVFSDSAELRRLEGILHPMIRRITHDELRSEAALAAPYVIHMVPLLFEAKDSATRMHCAVVVDVDEATQIERVVATRGVTAGTVQQIIAAQMPRAARLARAQFVLDNRGSQESLARQVDDLHRVLTANALLHRQHGIEAPSGLRENHVA